MMMNTELEQMYQEVILEASKNPHGRESFAQDLSQENSGDMVESPTLHATHESCTVGQSHQFNPTCGDEVTLRLELEHLNSANHDAERIRSIVWDGHGCSISQASLSIMVDLVEGKTLEETQELSSLFHQLMQSRGQGLSNENDEEQLDDAIVFQGVSKYPMRIKCALLGWEALTASLAQAMTQQ